MRTADDDTPVVAAEAAGLARAIMELTDDHDRLVVGAALGRCLAGLYARMAVDAGDPPRTAAAAVLLSAIDIAHLADDLVARRIGEAE